MPMGCVVDAERAKRGFGKDDDIVEGICRRLNSPVGLGG